MALKETVGTLKTLLTEIGYDLEKANEGNKAASQRVRTASIRFEKMAKVYRKESISAEKKAGPKVAKIAAPKKSTAKKIPAKKSSKAPLKKKR